MVYESNFFLIVLNFLSTLGNYIFPNQFDSITLSLTKKRIVKDRLKVKDQRSVSKRRQMEIFADRALSFSSAAISSIESRFPQWPTPPTTTKYSCRYHYWKTNIFRVVGPDKQKQPFVYNISIASRGRVFYPINSEFFQFNFYFGCGIADLLVCKQQHCVTAISPIQHIYVHV